MEMHQVRYFLAVARLLNFTRAAEACNVAQPSLTRAISMLEAEFGGDLFRRERRNTHLTQLGDRMLPILRQCYESAQSAKALASSVKTGGKVSLTIAIGDTVDIAIIVPQIQELARGIKGLEFALMRGPQEKIAEDLKSGAAEVAVTESFDQPWDRLDMWPLITERFVFACSKSHRLAGRSSVDLRELAGEHSIVGNSCEALDTVLSALNADRKDTGVGPGLLSEHDCVALIAANLAVGVLPARCARSDGISTGKYCHTRADAIDFGIWRLRPPTLAGGQHVYQAAQSSRLVARCGRTNHIKAAAPTSNPARSGCFCCPGHGG